MNEMTFVRLIKRTVLMHKFLLFKQVKHYECFGIRYAIKANLQPLQQPFT
jgi:hypothetical protein